MQLHRTDKRRNGQEKTNVSLNPYLWRRARDDWIEVDDHHSKEITANHIWHNDSISIYNFPFFSPAL